MNPLPDQWVHLRSLARDANAFVVVDVAMQPLLAERVTQCDVARSLLPGSPAEARDLGPWLLDEVAAVAIGLDGCGRGVNWLLSESPGEQLVEHLSKWTAVALPGEAGMSYLRIADGRVLHALLPVWTGTQRASFFRPTAAWCMSDRDGKGICITLPPADNELHRGTARLTRTQYEQLLAAAVPDQILHELKGYVVPHEDWPTRESRYSAAERAIRLAQELGYATSESCIAFVAAVLKHGEARLLNLCEHPAVKAKIDDALLWSALVEEINE